MQKVSEKVGGAEGTKLDDDFKEMEKVKTIHCISVEFQELQFIFIYYLLSCITCVCVCVSPSQSNISPALFLIAYFATFFVSLIAANLAC